MISDKKVIDIEGHQYEINVKWKSVSSKLPKQTQLPKQQYLFAGQKVLNRVISNVVFDFYLNFQIKCFETKTRGFSPTVL